MTTPGMPPYQPPVEPIYGIYQSAQDMGANYVQARRTREEIAREIGRTAIQGTHQPR